MTKPVLTMLIVLAAATSAAARSGSSYILAGRIAGPDGGWDLASVDPVHRRLYVARSNGVMTVDLRTGQVTPQLVAGQRGHAALAIPATDEAISTNGAADTALIFDGATGRVRATIPTGTKPDAVVYDSATHTLWVMNPGSGNITVIDPATARVLATVMIGGSLELGAADGQGLLFVNVEDRNDVAVIDTRARKLVRRIPLQGCDGPTGLAYARDARLIVSACANGVAEVVAPDGRQIAKLAIGTRPDGALYDEKRHLAFIPSGGDGTLSIIRLSPTPALVGKVATMAGARTAALDPIDGRIYLPSARFAPAIGNARPQPIPGSFAVLVVAPDEATR